MSVTRVRYPLPDLGTPAGVWMIAELLLQVLEVMIVMLWDFDTAAKVAETIVEARRQERPYGGGVTE